MSHYRRARVPGGTYFFTVVAERRQPILTHADGAAIIGDTSWVARGHRPRAGNAAVSYRWLGAAAGSSARHLDPARG